MPCPIAPHSGQGVLKLPLFPFPEGPCPAWLPHHSLVLKEFCHLQRVVHIGQKEAGKTNDEVQEALQQTMTLSKDLPSQPCS